MCTTLVTKHKSTSQLLSTNTGDQKQDKGKAAKTLILIPNKHQKHPTTRVKFRQLKNYKYYNGLLYTATKFSPFNKHLL